MRSIRINTRKLAERRSRKRSDLGVMGGPAKMIFENFETLTNMKPSLDLLSAENDEPPTMSQSNTPKGLSLNNDPEIPTDSDITGGDFPDGTKIHTPPHQNESVDQSNSNLKDNKPVEASKKQVFASQEEAQAAQEDFKLRYRVAQKIANIKIAAGLIEDVTKDDFVDGLVDDNSTEQLESILGENEQMFDRMQTQVQAQKQASVGPQAPSIPTVRMGGPAVKAVDDLSAIMSGL